VPRHTATKAAFRILLLRFLLLGFGSLLYLALLSLAGLLLARASLPPEPRNKVELSTQHEFYAGIYACAGWMPWQVELGWQTTTFPQLTHSPSTSALGPLLNALVKPSNRLTFFDASMCKDSSCPHCFLTTDPVVGKGIQASQPVSHSCTHIPSTLYPSYPEQLNYIELVHKL